MILLFFFWLPLAITLCVLVSELLAAWKTLHSQKKSSIRSDHPTGVVSSDNNKQTN